MGDDVENKPDKSLMNQDGINQDELIMQQQREIEKEISDTISLIGDLMPLASLELEYINDPIYKQKIKDLTSKYKSIRRTRPDGNCFFRAFSFSYLERLIDNLDDYQKFIKLASKSKDDLIKSGFPQFTVEDFYDTFMEVVLKTESTIKDESPSAARTVLLNLFNEQGYSDYMVVYLRLITSGQLQKDEEFYQNFIEGDRTVADFCHQEVEPMYKESDHIHIIALCTALNAGVRVEYMDRGEGGQVIAHDFPEGSTPSVFLLYRPGHYDILYP